MNRSPVSHGGLARGRTCPGTGTLDNPPKKKVVEIQPTATADGVCSVHGITGISEVSPLAPVGGVLDIVSPAERPFDV